MLYLFVEDCLSASWFKKNSVKASTQNQVYSTVSTNPGSLVSVLQKCSQDGVGTSPGATIVGRKEKICVRLLSRELSDIIFYIFMLFFLQNIKPVLHNKPNDCT